MELFGKWLGQGEGEAGRGDCSLLAVQEQVEQDLGWQSHGFAEMPWLGRRVQRLGLDVAPGLQPKHLHSHPRPRDCRCWMRPLPGDIRGFRLENLGRGLSPTQHAPWRPLLPLGHDRCQIHAWSMF